MHNACFRISMHILNPSYYIRFGIYIVSILIDENVYLTLNNQTSSIYNIDEVFMKNIK